MGRVFFWLLSFVLSQSLHARHPTASAPYFIPSKVVGGKHRVLVPWVCSQSITSYFEITYKKVHFRIYPKKNKQGGKNYFIVFGEKGTELKFRVKKRFFIFMREFLGSRGRRFPGRFFRREEILMRNQFRRLHYNIVKAHRKNVLLPDSLVKSSILDVRGQSVPL